MTNSTRRFIWLAALLLLLGAALRILTMQVHGLDGDDAFSLMMADQPLGVLLRTFANIEIERHPKLYFLLLHGWTRLLGTSDFSGHLFSTMVDLLLGAALVRFGAAIFDRRVGLIAGLLWAANPLLIWTSGHVRMYTLLAALAGVAWLALILAMERPRPALWIIAAAATAGAAYTHILGFVVLVGSGLLAGLALLMRWRWGGIAAMAAAGVAYVPYALNLWAIRTSGANVSDRPPQSPLDFVLALLTSLTANRPPVPEPLLWLLALGALALIVFAVRQRPRSAVVGTLAVLAVMSLAAAWFALQEGIFASKYVSYVAPPFLLALAAGIGALRPGWLHGAALAGLVAFGAVGLVAQVQPRVRPDFPAAAGFVETHGDEGDAVFILSNYGERPFDYYYNGGAPILAPWYGLPTDRPLDELVTLPDADTLWLLLYQTNAVDPENRLDRWLGEQFPVRGEAFPGSLTVRGYDLRPQTAALPPGVEPLGLSFGGQARLHGAELASATVSREDERLHPPSGWVHLTLYWESLEPGAAFRPLVRIEGQDGGVYGEAVERENDVLHRHPPETWQAGEVWRTDFDINLNPAMPPGEYKIALRVAGPDGALLPLDGAGGQDWHIVDWVTVTR